MIVGCLTQRRDKFAFTFYMAHLTTLSVSGAVTSEQRIEEDWEGGGVASVGGMMLVTEENHESRVGVQCDVQLRIAAGCSDPVAIHQHVTIISLASFARTVAFPWHRPLGSKRGQLRHGQKQMEKPLLED